MSHRIIEKRRRDRMNNCLADLSRLIPAEYLKKGRGRIEKTEIIEMAIRHMKHLQAHACRHADQCDLAQQQQQQQPSPEEAAAEPPGAGGGGGGGGAGGGIGGSGGGGAASAGAPGGPIVLEHYRLGYQECLSEAMHFMVEVEGFFAGDPLCVQLINHLQRHCERILKGDRLNFPRTHLGETTSSSGSSCGSGRGRSAGGGGGGGGGSGGGLGSSGLGSASASASGSGSSPGSCSDSGRAEPRDSGVGGGGGGSAGRRGALAPLGLALAARHDDCYEEGAPAPAPAPAPPLGSQLRDMLTNAPADWRRHGDLLMFSLAAAGTGGLAPHPATLGVTSVIHNGSAPPLPPQQHQLPPASPGPAPDGAPGPLYKFKNNIKQRFSAEHHHSGAGGPLGAGGAPYGAPKRRRYASETEDGPGAAGGNLLSLSLHRRDSETCSVPSPPASPPPLAQQPPASARSPLLPSPASSPPPVKFALAGAQPPPPPAAAHGPPAPPARPVPIFALHSRGAYYVPLTLDADALAPYLAECGCVCACGCEGAEAHGPCAPPVALHPVTISVNFSRAPASAPAPAPCARPAARHLGACGAPAAMVAPAPGLPWKVEPAPWKAEPGAFASPRWPEALPERG